MRTLPRGGVQHGLKIRVWTVRFCPWAPRRTDDETECKAPARHRVSLAEWSPTQRDLGRFWRKVDRSRLSPGGCWIWTGARTGAGYGSFAIVSTKRPVVEAAHRVSWRLAHGRAPAGVLCHRCDNPRCIQPAHLFEGTNADNLLDAAKKGRLGKRALRLIGSARAEVLS